jgi:hypothetical protein
MKPEQPEAARAPRGRHRPTARRAVVALLALALLAAGCTRKPPPPPGHGMAGTYIVHGIFPHRSYGAPCTGADAGYPDIRPGITVRVRDAATGALLGTVALEGGTLRKGPLRGRDDDCVFSFSVTVPERDVYRIEVGQRGSVRFQRSDLERSGWKADLTIGAYTMFGGI